MMGAICSAVSLAGSSSGPVALFWLRLLFNYPVCANIKRWHAGVQCVSCSAF